MKQNVIRCAFLFSILAASCAQQDSDKLGVKQSHVIQIDGFYDYYGEGDTGDYYADGDGFYDMNDNGYYDSGDPGDEDSSSSESSSTSNQSSNTGPRTCGDGLTLAPQDSANGQPASFTTQGQSTLAHCVQNKYHSATGGNLTINSGTRTVPQQAYAMFVDIYKKKGCSYLTRQYQGRGRGHLVTQMCDIATSNGNDQTSTIAQWQTIVTQAAQSGVPFSNHEIGRSIDIALPSSVDDTALNNAIADCGGTRNPEQDHAHVDMPADASMAAPGADPCAVP